MIVSYEGSQAAEIFYLPGKRTMDAGAWAWMIQGDEPAAIPPLRNTDVTGKRHIVLCDSL